MLNCVAGFSRPWGLLTSRPVLLLLLPQDTALYRKRWPVWVAVERMRAHLTWRTSQAAAMGWATADRPQLSDACQLPGPYMELVNEAVKLSLYHHKPARDSMLKTVNECISRCFRGSLGGLPH